MLCGVRRDATQYAVIAVVLMASPSTEVKNGVSTVF